MYGHYNHTEIEDNWRKNWQKLGLSKTKLNSSDNFYCLDMFPYPSGEGLHVGHWRGYVMSDFYARYHMLQGKSVFHPMGFDAFGLPAENAAIKHKSHPKKFTDQAIASFTKQLNQIGSLYNWDNSLTTSDPSYYRWTQWLFLQLYKNKLAEKRKSLVNWCPLDQTVLANEQVVQGKCERCGTTITKKELSQWYFKTTEFAEELLADLKGLEWPEHVKTLQRNWIGRSEGAELTFKTDKGRDITVFTTRIDTLPGVTAVVLAPEHSLANYFVLDNRQDEYKKYLTEALAKTNIDRSQSEETEKTAFFTGSYAINPLNGEQLPIWLADYVLAEYGTGAIMAVPAHDERDSQFAKAHDIETREVVSEKGVMVNSGELNKLPSAEAAKKIIEKVGAEQKVSYRLRDWLVSRQRYWGAPIPIVYDPQGNPHPVKEEHLPLELPEDVDFLPGGESPLSRSQEYLERAEKLYGKGWQFDTDTLDTFVDSSWYFMRYLSANDDSQAFDKDLVKKWLPIDLCIGGIEHATLHLLYARFVTKFLAKYKYIDSSVTEPFKGLFNIGMINLHGTKMSKSKGNVISPDPLVEHYGTDALRGYELFLGPMDIEVEWNPRGISGVHRFLIKLWNLADKATNEKNTFADNQFNLYMEAIEPMIKTYRLNTVLAKAMSLVNEVTKSGISKETFKKFIITLSPIFPFITEEIYQQIGGKKESIFMEEWPKTIKINNAVSLGKKLKIFYGKKLLSQSNDDRGIDVTVEMARKQYSQLEGKKYIEIDKPSERILKFFD